MFVTPDRALPELSLSAFRPVHGFNCRQYNRVPANKKDRHAIALTGVLGAPIASFIKAKFVRCLWYNGGEVVIGHPILKHVLVSLNRDIRYPFHRCMKVKSWKCSSPVWSLVTDLYLTRHNAELVLATIVATPRLV